MEQRKKIAAVVTTYHPASHADVIVTKFLKGVPTDDGLLPLQLDIVSIPVLHDQRAQAWTPFDDAIFRP